ncbi:MAG: formylglycine-generating enzyme family protein [Alphaproteobacteria bacterium]|nr:formylglycine-generating enzyme family protein [Alphaproteobacteria bacterium]
MGPDLPSAALPHRRRALPGALALGLALAIIGSCAALPDRAAAQVARRPEALVVSVSRYEPAAPHAAATADTVARALEEAGFAVRRLREPLIEDVRQMLRDLPQHWRNAPFGVAYVTGLGFGSDGDNRLLPVGEFPSDPLDAGSATLSIDTLIGRIEVAGTRALVLVDIGAAHPALTALGAWAAPPVAQAAGRRVAVAVASPGQRAAPTGTGPSILGAAFVSALEKAKGDASELLKQTEAEMRRLARGPAGVAIAGTLAGRYASAPSAARPAAPQPANPAPAIPVPAAPPSTPTSTPTPPAPAEAAPPPAPPTAPPVAAPQALALQQAPASPPDTAKPGDRLRDCPECPDLVVIPAGAFSMGAADDEPNPNGQEQPRRQVTVDRPLAFAAREVTRAAFAAFVKDSGRKPIASCMVQDEQGWSVRSGADWQDPRFKQADDEPVVCVSWEDAAAYAAWLAARTGRPYRLPSEAEWEYAARAGSAGRHYWPGPASDICKHENVLDAAGLAAGAGKAQAFGCDDGFARTAPVGRFPANPFGLHDMLGNVHEWTQDCWHKDYAGAPATAAPRLDGNCELRTIRGGSWVSREGQVRAARRLYGGPGTGVAAMSIIGFRVVRDLVGDGQGRGR